jgi:hypothetical protein
MISYNKLPKTIDLAENNCGAIISGSNLYINQGTQAMFQIYQPNLLVACSIYLPDVETGGQIRFDVVSFPDDSGYQVPIGINAEELAKQLRQNYQFSKNWEIVYLGADIIDFKSRLKSNFIINGLDYIMVDPPEALSFLNVSNGVATQQNSGYKIYYRVSIEKDYLSDTFETNEFFGDADSEGKLPIHLSFLKSYFVERDLPQVNQNIVSICTNTIKRYRISAAEYYDNIMRRLYESDIFYMLSGKMRPFDYVDVNLPDLILNTLAYLKHSGTQINTTNDAQQYLYYLSPTNNVNTLYLKTEKFFDDGTANEIVNINLVDTLGLYQVLLIPVGFKALAFDAHAKKDHIYKFQVSLYDDGGTQLGKIMEYYVRKKTDRDMIFLYQNRYGVFDTFIGTGESQREHIIDSEITEKYLPLDYLATDSQLVSENKNDYPSFKINTGGFTPDLVLEIEAMLASNHFYQIINNKYIRCELIKSNHSTSDSMDSLSNVEFEYRYALK